MCWSAVAGDGARERLGGGFQRDQEYKDLRVTLDQLIVDKPALERKLNAAKYILADAKAWLDALPDDAVLELVASTKPDGFDLDAVQSRIRDAEDEAQRLRGVPVPPPDIKERVREYVATLARPKVSGIGQQLRVSWPNDTAALLALLLPDETTSALMREIERQSNLPMPLPQRQQRIAELTAEIDTLRWQARALGDTALPPAYLLGVRVARREPAKRAASA